MNGAIQGRNHHNEELYQSAISSYEAETQSTQNNAHREAKTDNISNHSLNTDFNAQQASIEVITPV